MRALSRKSANRKSLLRNLATSLVLYERIETTEAKAKEVKSVVEHLISLAKKNDLVARRQLLSYFFDENATKKVLEVLLPKYDKTTSGFVKTYRKGNRLGDGAMIMILELKKSEVETEEIEPTELKAENKLEGKDGKVKTAKKGRTTKARDAVTSNKATKK